MGQVRLTLLVVDHARSSSDRCASEKDTVAFPTWVRATACDIEQCSGHGAVVFHSIALGMKAAAQLHPRIQADTTRVDVDRSVQLMFSS
jgi:hypothetical protein